MTVTPDELEKLLRDAADPNREGTWEGEQWEALVNASNDLWERAMRDDFKWCYVVRDPFDRVCAWGRGERDECVREAFKSADDHAAAELVWHCEEIPERMAQAITGPWRLVLWPPRYDPDPRSWFELNDYLPPPDPVSA